MILIDSDGGIDDLLCLSMASVLAHTRILGLSAVYGNVDLEQAANNLAYSYSLLGSAPCPPIGLGASKAADGFKETASHVHGENGLGCGSVVAVHSPTISFPAFLKDVTESLTRSGEKLDILAIGPATNIPSIVNQVGIELIKSITLMSGVFFDRGNITEDAEFNAYNDPFALNAVLEYGLPVNIVPLDICRKVLLTNAQIDALAVETQLNVEPLISSLKFYAKNYGKYEAVDGCFPHDAIALLVLLFPEKFAFFDATVTVRTDQKHRGQTVLTKLNPKKPNCRIAFGGDLKWVRQFISSGWLSSS